MLLEPDYMLGQSRWGSAGAELGPCQALEGLQHVHLAGDVGNHNMGTPLQARWLCELDSQEGCS